MAMRDNVLGLHTLQTIKWEIERADNPRAKAFWLLSYSRMTDEARDYLNQFVKREG